LSLGDHEVPIAKALERDILGFLMQFDLEVATIQPTQRRPIAETIPIDLEDSLFSPGSEDARERTKRYGEIHRAADRPIELRADDSSPFMIWR
jgi:hypothetical protein